MSTQNNFFWPKLERQVRISGIAKQIPNPDSDNYFKSRPRDSQMGAWVSKQSTTINLHYNLFDYLL